MPQGFFSSLKVAASGPYALIAYALLVGAWVYFATSPKRLQTISKVLHLIPKEDRKEVLEGEYRTLPRNGLTAEQWIAARRMTLFFLAFLALLVASSAITILAMTLYAPKARASGGSDDSLPASHQPAESSAKEGSVVKPDPCQGPVEDQPMSCLGKTK